MKHQKTNPDQPASNGTEITAQPRIRQRKVKLKSFGRYDQETETMMPQICATVTITLDGGPIRNLGEGPLWNVNDKIKSINQSIDQLNRDILLQF